MSLNSHMLIRRRRGMAMVEALISLAICASLLAAVGTAVVAASGAVKTNDEFTRAVQLARVILTQLEDQIRSGTLDESVTTDANGNATQLTIILADEKVKNSDGTYKFDPDRTYKYDATSKQLILTTNSSLTDPDFILARNVSACRFGIQKGTDASGQPAVTQVSITLTVSVGKNSVTLSGSAAPRRSLAK